MGSFLGGGLEDFVNGCVKHERNKAEKYIAFHNSTQLLRVFDRETFHNHLCIRVYPNVEETALSTNGIGKDITVFILQS